ncbi:hypothetical protein [Butyrivibrio sp. WCD2001]|uniref:hypothetical protein n=1 Tax=Butyrivibrio sp. WCD2001 TaxID=1280681 RepID=UPI000429A292|nr:hypothetical protein [Butyrivibrio sp. WCD2001]
MVKKLNKNRWLWEFSKRVVLICTALFVIGDVYSMGVMLLYENFDSLPTFIDCNTQILRDCVFAYMVKSGLENIFKIRGGYGE